MTAHKETNQQQSDTARQRRRTGVILCSVGVLLNLLLFTLKTVGGKISGSVAVTADGFNNLADTGSCILTLSGFLFGAKKPDRKYPMGCGRLEYLSGLLISELILLIGAKMLFSSLTKILRPEPVDGSFAVISILIVSILIKGVMYRYNSVVGRRLRSSGMRAAAIDSLSDCCATLAILIAVIIERLTGFFADGWTGIPVALCILYAGVTSVKESVEPLLGRGADKELQQKLASAAGRYRLERIALHDYGPHRKLLTAYLCADISVEELSALRERIRSELQMEAVICPCRDFLPSQNKPNQKGQE